jgi:hypothetical protein
MIKSDIKDVYLEKYSLVGIDFLTCRIFSPVNVSIQI